MDIQWLMLLEHMKVLIKHLVNYALMPVWMMTYSSGSKNYIFAMNGQTGKVFVLLPVSKGKIALYDLR